MRSRIALTLTFCVVSIIGCISSASFQRWDGPDEFLGKGGTFRKVDSIEIWELGSPSRKFRALGIIDAKVVSSAGFLLVFGDSWTESKLVDEAKKNKADGVIFVTGKFDSYGFVGDPPAAASKKVIVFKYIEESGKNEGAP